MGDRVSWAGARRTFAETVEQIKNWLTRAEANPALGKAAYKFNPARYEWTRRAKSGPKTP